METVIAGRTLMFFDCREVGQAGPEACSISLDGSPIANWRFDPSPLEFRGAILIPVRKPGLLDLGYALARIEQSSRNISVISRVYGYMKLLRVEGETLVFATSTYGADTDSITLS